MKYQQEITILSGKQIDGKKYSLRQVKNLSDLETWFQVWLIYSDETIRIYEFKNLDKAIKEFNHMIGIT